MIRHSVASYIRDNKPEMLETAAGFMKHSLDTCKKSYAEASIKGELYFPSIWSHFTLFEIILWNWKKHPEQSAYIFISCESFFQ
jgi:hypothetical protein